MKLQLSTREVLLVAMMSFIGGASTVKFILGAAADRSAVGLVASAIMIVLSLAHVTITVMGARRSAREAHPADEMTRASS